MKIKTLVLFIVFITFTSLLSANDLIKPQRYYELPLKSIKPDAWLKDFLQLQRDGLTGHAEISGYPFNTNMWAGDHISANPNDENEWAAYEQTAYYIDALVKCGFELNDPQLIEKAREQIDYVLSHATKNGFLGPEHVGNTRWPQAVFFRALMAWHSATGDHRIVKAMERHYLNDIQALRSNNEAVFEGNVFGRNDCHVEGMCWVYEHTGNKLILDYAQKIYEASNEIRWQTGPEKVATHHGVSYSEKSKLPVILYMQTGDPLYLRASLGAFTKGQEHLLIDGIVSSTEGLSGNRSRVSHESCVVSDYSWSAGYMLMATQQTKWADKIEQVCFNAGIGAVGKDFKTHQYLSSPNQFLATTYSNHEEHHKNRMAYRPAHPVKCCTGNIHRFMPNYISRMWLADDNNGLVAALFGPCSVTSKVGRNKQQVTIQEITDYPFSETITFKIQTRKTVLFPLSLRIPEWATGASLKVNGKESEISLIPGHFSTLERAFNNGDVVTLHLPMKLRPSHWPDTGIGFEYGPLVMAYPIPAEKKEVRFVGAGNKPDISSLSQWPAWDMTPAGPWNYAISRLDTAIAVAAKVKRHRVTSKPWAQDQPPLEIRIPARRVANWKLQKVHDKKFDMDCVYTPHLPLATDIHVYGEPEYITLVPLGCTDLRLTIFPYAPGGSDFTRPVKSMLFNSGFERNLDNWNYHPAYVSAINTDDATGSGRRCAKIDNTPDSSRFDLRSKKYAVTEGQSLKFSFQYKALSGNSQSRAVRAQVRFWDQSGNHISDELILPLELKSKPGQWILAGSNSDIVVPTGSSTVDVIFFADPGDFNGVFYVDNVELFHITD